jgi:hypothetical protein
MKSNQWHGYGCVAKRAGRLLLICVTAMSASAVGAGPPAEPTNSPQVTAANDAMKDFDDTVRRGDSMYEAGKHFEAVLAYERASRVAYNNKLKIDAAGLQAKLAAARAGRDAAKAASPSPAPQQPAPAAPPSAQAQQPIAGSSTSPSAARKEYDDAVQQGDTFASAGDYAAAIKEYERAARVAYNNKLPTDPATLAAKLANVKAAQTTAAAAPRELLPPPPPPVSDYSGPRRLPETPGKLRPWRFTNFAADLGPQYRPTPAEAKAFEANLLRIAEVIKSQPMFNPPVGIEVEITGHIRAVERVGPLTGNVGFGAYGYFEERVRVKATGAIQSRPVTGDETTGVDIRVNEVPANFAGHHWDDEQGQMFLEPMKVGEIAGYPVYGEAARSAQDMYILRPGDELWLPVRMDRFVKQWVADRKKWAEVAESVLASRRKEAQAVLSQEKRESRRREIEAERAKGGNGVEQNVRRLEVIAKRLEDDAQKVLDAADEDPKYREPIREYRDAQALAVTLTPASSASVPCIKNADNPSAVGDKLRLVTAGTAGCRRVMSFNSALFRPGAPRSAIRFLSVPQVTACSRELREQFGSRGDLGGCLSVVQMLRGLDWKRLEGLIQP